jgi:O-antigen/teichoic acid export membrane protein
MTDPPSGHSMPPPGAANRARPPDDAASRSAESSGPADFAPVSRRWATIVTLIFQNAGIVLTIARGIVVVPVYLWYINDTLYGAWLASGNIITWLSLSEGGFSYLLRQQTAEFYGQGHREQLGRSIGSGLVITVALCAVALLLGVVLTPFCAGWFGLQGNDARQLVWSFGFAAVAMPLGMLAGGFRAVQQGFQRPGGIGWVGLSAEVVSLVFSVVLVASGWGLVSIGSCFVVREVINLLGMGLLTRRTVRDLAVPVRFELHTARELLGLTGWTFLNYAGEWILKSCDAFLVAMFLGPRWATVTELTKRAWDVLSGTMTRLAFSFQPGLAHVHGAGDSKKFMEVAHHVLAVVTVSFGLGAGVMFALNEPFMRLWVGADKFAGVWYNELWGLAAACNVLVFAAGQILIAAANIRGSAIAQSAGNLARAFVLAALLVATHLLGAAPTLGILAVPVSTLLATLALGGPLLLWEWRKTLRVSAGHVSVQAWGWGRALLLAGVLAALWWWVPTAQTWPWLILHGASLGALLFFAFCFVDQTFRELVRTGVSYACRLAATRLGAGGRSLDGPPRTG